MATTISIYNSLMRQVNHWLMAASKLSVVEHLASPQAWQGIDHQIGVMLRESFKKSIDDVLAQATSLQRQLENAGEQASLSAAKRGVQDLRNRYLKAEESIHFYTVAINSRTTPGISALLRGCDILCVRSMQELLKPLAKATPPVLTYIDKGVGASILKAGLRLWDGNVSNVAAIKVTQHNLYRPTAIIHETGHQMAHILNWNEELSAALNNELTNHAPMVGEAFSRWSSEMAADAFAFVHTGFAAVAALHDVVSGMPHAVFAYHQHDPHPISYLRVLMNIEMCRQFYGAGPWDDLEEAFKDTYDINMIAVPSVGLINLCVSALPDVVNILLKRKFRAFGERSLSAVILPERVSPRELEKLEQQAGPALYTSHAWIWKECLRLLALGGYKIGLGKGDLPALYKQQEEWMTKLGFAVELN
ncbi:hypothetical protein [Paraflavitalea sp. CAU 1676]|uniref:hypothetical protein n=1 Tax=Paraflavitalea sp. CAU 1676 TaxID=3032598 RepID=UPI0023DC04C0|nr:hypothetical protein [Paraflavitalea sp. CAU 1676]MDF2188384.1 hypothetical protein [Paraflavitalea sp. CAU 1676]